MRGFEPARSRISVKLRSIRPGSLLGRRTRASTAVLAAVAAPSTTPGSEEPKPFPKRGRARGCISRACSNAIAGRMGMRVTYRRSVDRLVGGVVGYRAYGHVRVGALAHFVRLEARRHALESRHLEVGLVRAVNTPRKCTEIWRLRCVCVGHARWSATISAAIGACVCVCVGRGERSRHAHHSW